MGNSGKVMLKFIKADFMFLIGNIVTNRKEELLMTKSEFAFNSQCVTYNDTA